VTTDINIIKQAYELGHAAGCAAERQKMFDLKSLENKEVRDEPNQAFNPEIFNQEIFKKIDELELSLRPWNCLKNANIIYVADLIQKSESELLRIENFGRRSLNEVKEVLSVMNLRLGMNETGLLRVNKPKTIDIIHPKHAKPIKEPEPSPDHAEIMRTIMNCLIGSGPSGQTVETIVKREHFNESLVREILCDLEKTGFASQEGDHWYVVPTHPQSGNNEAIIAAKHQSFLTEAAFRIHMKETEACRIAMDEQTLAQDSRNPSSSASRPADS
jgi:hypothetical protein